MCGRILVDRENLLYTRPHQVYTPLEHEHIEFHLSYALVRVLFARAQIECWTAIYIVSEDDLLPGDCFGLYVSWGEPVVVQAEFSPPCKGLFQPLDGSWSTMPFRRS